jgi:hypothetical protein
MISLNILAWQYEDGTCRFIYQVSGSKDLHVVSCEDYTGVVDLMRDAQATKLDKSVNLYDYRRDLYRELQLS